MVFVRTFLAACTVACSLAEAALDQKEDLHAEVPQLEEKPVVEEEVYKAEEGSDGPFAEANRDPHPPKRMSRPNDLALGVVENPVPPLGGKTGLHHGRGRGRLVRRQNSPGGIGIFGGKKLPIGIPLTPAFDKSPASPTSPSKRLFARTSPPHAPPKNGFPRSAIMTILLFIAIVWLVKQVKLYRRAQASLGVMREDLDKLLSQAERNRVVNNSSSLDPNVHTHGTEAEEDARNAELVAELHVARSQLSDLRQALEEEEARFMHEREEDDLKPTMHLTKQEALQEIRKLEADGLRMQKQRQDLEAVMKMRSLIQKEDMVLRKGAERVRIISSGLGDLGGLTYQHLLDLIQLSRSVRNDEEADQQILQIKKRLVEALKDAKKVCAWNTNLLEWSLVIERDQLEEELLITHRNGRPPMTFMERLYADLSYYKNLARGTTTSLSNSLNSFWNVMDKIRGVEKRKSQEQEETAVDLSLIEVERWEEEEAKLREELENLRREVADEEAHLLAEMQLTGRLHTQDASVFGSIFESKKSEARVAARAVIAGLNSLNATKPIESSKATIDAARALTATLNSCISKAYSALDHVK
ncbi:hypothetical protein ACSSS7_006627 [Eimeria intestinalis]